MGESDVWAPGTAPADRAGSASEFSTAMPIGADAQRSMRARATVLDVARLAGVSGRTVSRVVAGGSKVSPQTHDRVMRAVRTLRFRPNRLAQGLRAGGVSTTVGFIIGDLSNPFYAQVAAGVEAVLTEFGLTMLLAGTRDDPSLEARTVGAVLEHRVRALLLVPVGDDHAYLEHERNLGTPIVAVDRPAANAELDSVVFDNRGGARNGIQHLIAAGHRRIAFVGSDHTIYTHEERLAGYRHALTEAGITHDPTLVRRDAPDAPAAYRATRDLLAGPAHPTAIFAANNIAALGALEAAHTHASPVAFLGFDDFDYAPMLKISVISHDPTEMGRTAARLALGGLTDSDRPPTRITLPTRMIHRGSAEQPPVDDQYAAAAMMSSERGDRAD
jgi:LacI family transcriptional regulator